MSTSFMQLPHNASGEIDWTTLGNILTARILGEVLCASYVDRAYGKVKDGAPFQAETDWKFIYKEDNIVALQKTFEDSPVRAFMGRGVIDRPMEDIVHYLETFERRKEWDRYLVDIRQKKAMSEIDFIMYMLLEVKNCLVKKQGEFVYYERIAHVDDKYVRTVLSLDLPEYPQKRSLIRGELHPGSGWVLEPYDNSRSRTLVSFLAHVDLKGLPPVIVNKIIRRQPKAIYRIRKVLTSPKEKTRPSSFPSFEATSTEDCFTASEQGIVMDASYAHRHYEEGISFEEFIGTPQESVRPRRFNSIPPKLTYCTETDSYTKPSKLLKIRSLSVDSGSTTSVSPRGSMYSSPREARSGGAPEGRGVATSGGAAAATGSKKVEVLELPISSNPMIMENTGFKGDSHLPLLVAALHDATVRGETGSENGTDPSLQNGDELESKDCASKDCHSEHAQTEERSLPTGPESGNSAEGACKNGGLPTTQTHPPQEGTVSSL